MKSFNCKHCNEEFVDQRKLAGHSQWCTKNPRREENLKKLAEKRLNAHKGLQSPKERLCKWCNQTKVLTGSQHQNHVRWCDKNPRSKQDREKQSARSSSSMSSASIEKMKASLRAAHERGDYKDLYLSRRGKPGHNHSEETKELLASKRQAFLRENPDLHPWKRNSKFISIPCEKLKEKLRELGLSFQEEFSPLDDRFFSIDIAFPDSKLGVEVNGEQHYNRDGTLKKYYQERHELITSAGWTLLELHYSMCYSNEAIKEIQDHLK